VTIPAARPGFALELAGHRFTLRSDDPAWARRIRARYEGFLLSDLPAPKDAFEIEVATGRAVRSADLESELREPFAVSRRADRLQLHGAQFAAEADLALRRASVSGPPFTYPVDALLRQLLAHLLDDGLLIHAALLLDGERQAFVASGPSGCGKSTLAGLLPEQAAADELVAVRLPPAGPPMAYGLPFWKGRPRQAPLAGVHLLRHAPACARTRLDPAAALRRVAPEVLWPAGPEAAVGARLDLLADLIARVPVWDLGFRPHPEVWETIAAEEVA